MKHWTLGSKLTAWSALVVAVALLISGVGVAFFIKEEQIEGLDELLTDEAHTFFRAFERLQARPGANSRADVKTIVPVSRTERFVKVIDAEAHVLYESKMARANYLPLLANGIQSTKAGDTNVRLGVFSGQGLTLYLGAALSEINSDTSQSVRWFTVGLALFIATVAGGGSLLARKALAPIREITAAAEQITAQRLDQRLLDPRSNDEIGRLTSVLNAMFARLEASFGQAMRFSADASHELKTPLTILRAGIEDLLESATLSPSDERAVATLLEQTRQLSSITQSLLLLS